MNYFKLTSNSPLILYGQMDSAWAHLEHIHARYVSTGASANCQILGVSGLGKSTLLKNYSATYPEKASATGRKIPVVYCPLPASPSPKTVMGAIVRAFNGADIGTASALMDRAAQYICRMGVELLLVDEAHHMVDRGRMKTHAHLGDCWKEFNDRVPCCIAMAGAPRLTQLFETNNQLRNRAGMNLMLRPFSYDESETAMAQFVSAVIGSGVLQRHGEFLTSFDALTRIQFATDGVQAHIVRLISNLAETHANAREINFDSMGKAWDVIGAAGLPATRSPFHQKFNFIRLSSAGEPFFPSAFDGDNHATYF